MNRITTGINWIKTGRTATEDGSVTTYAAEGHPAIRIESRKRQIPHAARGGTWAFTSYFVLLDGEEVVEKMRLTDAKEFAETLIREVRA
jgi:hypothetical protein